MEILIEYLLHLLKSENDLDNLYYNSTKKLSAEVKQHIILTFIIPQICVKLSIKMP